jgi:hypothetical protein
MAGGEGKKVWWVYTSDFGKAPFRWSVYHRLSGKQLARSEAFGLPSTNGQAVRMSVTLKP